MPRPDLVIVGDSHSLALHAAATERGIEAKMFFLGGNFWHGNHVRAHAERGLHAPGRPGLEKKISEFARELGGSVFPKDVPVLAVFGYHLGRIAPNFLRENHTPDALQAAFEDDSLFVSQAFLDGYLQQYRRSLYRILRLAIRQADMTVVAPPILSSSPLGLGLAARVTDHLMAMGLKVFDPRREPGFDQPLPEALRHEDNIHGNTAYGHEVLRRIEAKGLLRLPARKSVTKPVEPPKAVLPLSA